MLIKETLYLTDRKKWRAWLRKNHKIKKEIWLIYYKKHTGKPRIAYDDAVEEALCYGWIDSTIKKIDDRKFAQKFTPRNKNSNWSDLNIKRVKKLIKTGEMTKIGMELFQNREAGESEKSRSKSPNLNKMSPALTKALVANKKASENFNNFAPSYRRQYIGWVNSAKKEETIKKRIRLVVERSAKNIKPGML